MAEILFPLNNVDYKAEDMALYFSGRTTGVFSADGELSVTANGDMSVTVSPGRAWLNFDKFEGYIYANKKEKVLTIETADGTLNRIDRVVIGYDVLKNSASLYIKKGSLSSNPVPQEIIREKNSLYEICLAEIYIEKGTLSISSYNITDKRLDHDVCGLVSDGVNKIPTDVLNNTFVSWFEEKKNQLSGDVAGNLQLQIDDVNEVIDDTVIQQLNEMKEVVEKQVDKVIFGSSDKNATIKSKDNPTVTINDTIRKIYHEGNKPTVSEVGATSSTTPLATGSWLMTATQTVTLSKKISECQHGICLEWRDYGNGQANAKDLVYTFIPKGHAIRNNGKPLSVLLPIYEQGSTAITKYIYVYDSKIVGYTTNNTATNSAMVVLTAVFEV